MEIQQELSKRIFQELLPLHLIVTYISTQ